MTQLVSQESVLSEVWDFSLFEALFGRRARRFAYGMEIPRGPLTFKSTHPPFPLSELGQALLIAAGTGVTGWHFGIPYSREVKESVTPYSEELLACVGEMAQYVCDTYGKFPGTVPTIFMRVYVQAHHLDTEFYDTHVGPGSYLKTHARHMERWHGK